LPENGIPEGNIGLGKNAEAFFYLTASKNLRIITIIEVLMNLSDFDMSSILSLSKRGSIS
jgi:hypothetical protein